VQRLKAILLLALFAASLIPPATSTAVDAKLPACCRRDGRHHCAMLAQTIASRGASSARNSSLSVSQRQQPCPLFAKQSALPMPARLSLPAPSRLTFCVPPGRTTAASQAAPQGQDAFRQRQQERGPPSFSV